PRLLEKVSARHHRLEMKSPLNQQEAIRTRRVVGDFAEVGGGGVEVRYIELRPVDGIQGIHAQLEIHSFVNLEFALNIGVQTVQSVCPAGSDTSGKHSCLKRGRLQRRVGHEPGGVEPMIWCL